MHYDMGGNLTHKSIQKTSQKYLLQILQICNRIFRNLFAIAICNKRNLIALQFICNKPVIYWLMSDHIPTCTANVTKSQ